MKPRHRASENGVHAAVVHPASPDAVNARVVRFRVAFAILVDRQLFPLTTQIQDLQNVIEDLVKTQLRCRTAATDGEMRQDKLLELRELQLRRYRLQAVSFPHCVDSAGGAADYPVNRGLNPPPSRISAPGIGPPMVNAGQRS